MYNSPAIPIFLIKTPLKKLDVKYPPVKAKIKIPRASKGKPKLSLIPGQATPSNPSGNPKDIKAI